MECARKELRAVLTADKKTADDFVSPAAEAIAGDLGDFAENNGGFTLSDVRGLAKKHNATERQVLALVGILDPVFELRAFHDGVEQPMDSFAKAARAKAAGLESPEGQFEVRWVKKAEGDVHLPGRTGGQTISDATGRQR